MKRVIEYLKAKNKEELASTMMEVDPLAAKYAKAKDIIAIIDGLVALEDELTEPTHVIFVHKVKNNANHYEHRYLSIALEPLKHEEVVVCNMLEMLPKTFLATLVSSKISENKDIEKLLQCMLHQELMFAFIFEHILKKDNYVIEKITEPIDKNPFTLLKEECEEYDEMPVETFNSSRYLDALISVIDEIKVHFEFNDEETNW